MAKRTKKSDPPQKMKKDSILQSSIQNLQMSAVLQQIKSTVIKEKKKKPEKIMVNIKGNLRRGTDLEKVRPSYFWMKS